MNNIDMSAMREFLKEKINIDTIKKYIFIKNMSQRFDEEYLDRMYRINSEKVKALYEQMDENDRKRLEKKILDQIATGEIDLSKEAVNWHREELKREKNSIISGNNISKANIKKHEEEER